MKALWLENQTLSYREDLPLPEPSTDETLIRVIKAGICSTDLEMMKGYYPFMGIPGHEFVGVVEKAPGDPSWVGKRVVGEINISCGECRACRRGHRTHCEGRKSVGIKNHDGVFAEYIKLPWGNLHVVPDSVSDDAAVFAEPLAAALEIQEQIHIHPTDRVLVIGAGRLGQLIAQVLAL
ncbi:MAG: alcohol dehydrogenase catalytic domain-containing protein, partial [Anaerolineales bacterium]|nr:alcohol dehydrogenase catalytic domain-containing protein [Anaerolineales bacterium]